MLNSLILDPIRTSQGVVDSLKILLFKEVNFIASTAIVSCKHKILVDMPRYTELIQEDLVAELSVGDSAETVKKFVDYCLRTMYQ